MTMTDIAESAQIDPTCAGAVDLARAAATEVAAEPAHVGAHVGVYPVADDVVGIGAVHRFGSEHPGYVGWVWAVSLSRVADSDHVTVDEVWLEPSAGALSVPPWQPWSERVQPGDLGAGDVFPTSVDDPRLTAGFTAADDPESLIADQVLHPLQWQIGLGRARVLSTLGREDAADRWHSGEGGPNSAVARAAVDRCLSCGWLMPIAGHLGQAFGVCAQPMSPSDGRVVSFDHGCGAHSEVIAEPASPDVVEILIDEVGFDEIEREATVEVQESVVADSSEEEPAPADL